MEKELLFYAKNMHKQYGPTIALKNVDFILNRGEIRGLVGENGSGKSTIMAIASGMHSSTSGSMIFKDKLWKPQSMIEAQRNGISMILQEANTLPDVTVAQNIFAGNENEFSHFGLMDMKRMTHEAQKLLESFGIRHIKAQNLINRYNYEDRKLIEIVRCVKAYTQILVVDESTTALSLEGRDILYRIMRKFADENKAVVFISHDLDEILNICTEVTVLRDGEIIGDISSEELERSKTDAVFHEQVKKKARFMMVGREIGEKYYRQDFVPSKRESISLEFKDIHFGKIKNFSFQLYAGEIVGLGGLSGCGMRDIGRIAFGLEKIDKGQVLCKGRIIRNSRSAIRSGIGYISKNRDQEALILKGPIHDTIVLPSLENLSKLTYISPSNEKRIVKQQIQSLAIKCRSGKQWVSTLSGGNKQKVSFAKWIAKDSDVLIMDCPTRGVDVGVKQAMYSLIETMKAQGKAILMISEELSELIGMADRVIIMKNDKISKEFLRSSDLKETDIIEYMV